MHYRIRLLLVVVAMAATWTSRLFSAPPPAAATSALAVWRSWLDSNPVPPAEFGPWHVAGPFTVTSVDGLDAIYPPEQAVDLSATYPGLNDARIKWELAKTSEGLTQVHYIRPPSYRDREGVRAPSSDPALVSPKNMIVEGVKDPSVVYLYRAIEAKQPCTVTVAWTCAERWVLLLNGQKHAMGPLAPAGPEYTLELNLKQGRNDLLLKIPIRKGHGAFAYRFKTPTVLRELAEESMLAGMIRGFSAAEMRQVMLERGISQDHDLLHAQIADREHWKKMATLVHRPESLILETDRDPVDVLLRRTQAACAELKKHAPAAAPLQAELRKLEEKAKSVPPEKADERRNLFADIHRLRRRVLLSDPRLDFDHILFAQSAPSILPHISDQYYGWWSRPGGGVYVLENFKGDAPRLRCLTSSLPEGSFIRPDLSYDGKKVLFGYARHYPHLAAVKDKRTKANVPEDAFYHLYEVNVDGSDLRQRTRGRYDDVDGRYSPAGDIIFLSTRKGTFLQTSDENTARTLAADLPDSYVRCGGNDFRPVPVFTLHALDSEGVIRPRSAFETFEYTPSIGADGQILYTRWDYIDRFNGHFFSLWKTALDGTNAQLVYGNYTIRPQTVTEAMPIPGSSRLIFTAGAHHSVLGGSLVLLDPSKGMEGTPPIRRLTPEVPFPETEKNIGSYYASPWPLAEDLYLAGWADRELPPHGTWLAKTGWPVAHVDDNPVNAMGLYLVDSLGNRELLYRDFAISSQSPIPLRARLKPPVAGAAHAWNAKPGAFLLHDVYAGLKGVNRGTVKRLRIVGVTPKVQPDMGSPDVGVSVEDTGKFVLGTVPVEEDGSAHFIVPSGVPVFFQAIDAGGAAIQTMRSLTYVAGEQTLSCVGCHEPRESAPRGIPQTVSLAAKRGPSRPSMDVPGTWPLSFDGLVKPVLDRYCISCHQPSGPEKARRFDLSPERAYAAMLDYAGRDLRKLAFERDQSDVGDNPARKSKLLAFLRSGHENTKLDAESEYRLIVWMDLYATRQGSFSEAQMHDLDRLRERWMWSVEGWTPSAATPAAVDPIAAQRP